MAIRQRVDKSFELQGPVTFIKSDKDKNGNPYVLLTVAGIGFFLPRELHSEVNYLEEGQIVKVLGEYAGQSVRNGQRQPNLEVYEILAGSALMSPPAIPQVHTNGVSKGQPA